VKHSRVVMRPQWRDLLFVHWEVSPELLRALVPRELDLDLFDGRAFIGLIPFAMRRVRPRFLPSPRPLFDPFETFLETNVRTYVRHRGENPGVWFFSLDAANLPAVLAGRSWFKLPYFYSRMSLARSRTANGTHLRYSSQRVWPSGGPELSITCEVRGTPADVKPAAPDTLEAFLVERYLLYSQSGGALFRGRVHHKPYRLLPVASLRLRENLLRAAGVERPRIEPHLCYSPDVNVEVDALERVI
jgi:uncharacterized protein YqjF (DUF2071 family)